MEEEKALLEMIKCFLENRKYASDQCLDEEKLYRLARKHRVCNFLVNWAKQKCQSEKVKNAILADYNEQIVRDTNENFELEKVLDQLEKSGIKTLVFKGVIMKGLYPQNYMRKMCDLDMMVQEEKFKEVSKIVMKLGYEKFYNHEKHLIFVKKPFVMLEIHRKLMVKKDVGYEFFKTVWDKCCPYQNYKNIVQLTLEEAYLYCILHLMIHFKFTGIQIRDVLDVYLYQEKYKNVFDYEKLNNMFEKLQITQFEKNIKRIAYQWFGEEKIEDFDEVEKFILKGVSVNNNVNYHLGQRNGKLSYALGLFFPEFKVMKEKYPILQKVPVLLPVSWIMRILKDVFSKETTVKMRLDTIKLIQETNQENVEDIQKVYKKLGIIRKE